jgi:RimJ/RimL family protein N-acetyltransferase
MSFPLQPTLLNEKVALYPLLENDFESLFAVASDPRIWEQHPNRDRWKRSVFLNYFEGAMKSNGALKIVDTSTGQIIGSTRFYDYNEVESTILIGYTFYAVACWGKGFNPAVKKLMLDHAFQHVQTVQFHIGATNFRSQVSIGRLGAKKVGEINVAYYGEPPKLNFIYEISS